MSVVMAVDVRLLLLAIALVLVSYPAARTSIVSLVALVLAVIVLVVTVVGWAV